MICGAIVPGGVVSAIVALPSVIGTRRWSVVTCRLQGHTRHRHPAARRPPGGGTLTEPRCATTTLPAAALTALDVLRAGGNAMDAAVAACAVLCVIEPQSTGIGGDCFCLYAPAGSGKVIGLNGSGRAPAAATIDWFEGAGINAIDHISAHAVTVPGALNAWETLLKAHGRKGLDELLQPAIRFAAEGWAVTPKVSWDWAR